MKSARKAISSILMTLGFLLVAGSLFAADATFMDDGKDTKVMRFNNLNDSCYCEIFLIYRDGATTNLSGMVYNTTGLNNKANVHDTCPSAMWAKIKTEALKKQYDVLGVFKRPPLLDVRLDRVTGWETARL